MGWQKNLRWTARGRTGVVNHVQGLGLTPGLVITNVRDYTLCKLFRAFGHQECQCYGLVLGLLRSP